MDDNHYFTIDFGVNFAHKDRYDEQKLDKIMKESWEAGVDKVVCISNTIEEAEYNLQLAKKYENLYFTLGVHPHDAKHFKLKDLKFIEENLTNPKCFGIGECGLDFNRNFSPQDKQIEAFEEQLKLAKKIPLVYIINQKSKRNGHVFEQTIFISHKKTVKFLFK